MRYDSAAVFRHALEGRLNARARERGEDLSRLRKIATFERFVARLQGASPDRWLLKGGFAMLLRIPARARTTKDVDLGFDLGAPAIEPPSTRMLHDALRDAVRRDAEDFFEFEIGEAGNLPLDAGPVRAFRFPVMAVLDRRPFERFHADAATGDPLAAPPVELPPSGLLDFAELPPVRFRAVAPEQHLAEKLHALTRPREDRENSRVRDLVDILLLISSGPVDPASVRRAIGIVFAARKTHPVPEALPDPPAAWDPVYARLAGELRMEEDRVETAMKRLRSWWRSLPR
jgi:hypothetical protein